MKTILCTLRCWVSLGIILLGINGGLAHAQFGTETKPFKTSNNCTVFRHSEAVSASIRAINWNGECKKGKIQGAGVLLSEFQSRADNQWMPVAEIGYWDNGAHIGMYLSAYCVENNKPDCITLYKVDRSGSSGIRFARDTQKRPKYHSSTDIEMMVSTMKVFEADISGLPTANTTELLDLMKAWSKDPEMTLTAFANFKLGTTRGAPKAADDPKVFGRNARGS